MLDDRQFLAAGFSASLISYTIIREFATVRPDEFNCIGAVDYLCAIVGEWDFCND